MVLVSNLLGNIPISLNIFKSKFTSADIRCCNCNGIGHIYKTCNHPVISYGIICYVKMSDENGTYPMYLMVQRKDSLAYVEFIRGKYDLSNKTYIEKMFRNMTLEECMRLQEKDFDVLWKEMWRKDKGEKNRNFTREYNLASEKFDFFKRGYLMQCDRKHDPNIIFFNMNNVINDISPKYLETEWGFPKGRRNMNEYDSACALREFREESGIDTKHIEIIYNNKPIEEVFQGTNRTRYKHVYFLAKLKDSFQDYTCIFDKHNAIQCKEIKDAKFFTYDSVMERIRETNIERRELFKRVHNIVCKNL
jgi:ADP-ribose pyrophosphatase YjhB (NUDIX family)